MPFQITSLPKSKFQNLFSMPAAELATHHAMRMLVTHKPGFPCRISLADAEVGEEVLLVHYEHQPADSPFRASHAVFVRPHVIEATPRVDEVPEMLRSRMLSLRAFDRKGMMVEADLADGDALEVAIEAMLLRQEAEYIHIHFAKPGCYAARVDRA
jgi:hypothetical protein